MPFDESDTVVDIAELVQLLTDAGVSERFLDFAVDSIEGLGRYNDTPVRWPKSIVDRAFAVLCVEERPMSPGEILDAMGTAGSERSFRQRLYEAPGSAGSADRRLGFGLGDRLSTQESLT